MLCVTRRARVGFAQGPAVTMVRRHTRGTDRMHYGPALHTVSGNYVAAKRKGVVDGVDYGFTGAVSNPLILLPAHIYDVVGIDAHQNLSRSECFSLTKSVRPLCLATLRTRQVLSTGAQIGRRAMV